MSDEDVEWSEFDFTFGRQSQLEVTSPAVLAERLRMLRGEQDAYLEVSMASRPYPRLAVSLRSGFGVLYGFRSDESVALLVEPSPVCDAPVWMPVLDTDTSFAPEFIHRRDDACNAVERFIECADLRELGSCSREVGRLAGSDADRVARTPGTSGPPRRRRVQVEIYRPGGLVADDSRLGPIRDTVTREAPDGSLDPYTSRADPGPDHRGELATLTQ